MTDETFEGPRDLAAGYALGILTPEELARYEAFLAEHLGGRYQPDVRPEIQERLDALTVDPAAVTLAPPAGGSGSGGGR